MHTHSHTAHTHTHTHRERERDNAHVHALRQPSRLHGHQVELLHDGILGRQAWLQLLHKGRELSAVTLDYVSASDQLTSTDGTLWWPLWRCSSVMTSQTMHDITWVHGCSQGRHSTMPSNVLGATTLTWHTLTNCLQLQLPAVHLLCHIFRTCRLIFGALVEEQLHVFEIILLYDIDSLHNFETIQLT